MRDKKFNIMALRLNWAENDVPADLVALISYAQAQLLINDTILLQQVAAHSLGDIGLFYTPIQIGPGDDLSVRLVPNGGKWPELQSEVKLRLILDGMIARRVS